MLKKHNFLKMSKSTALNTLELSNRINFRAPNPSCATGCNNKKVTKELSAYVILLLDDEPLTGRMYICVWNSLLSYKLQTMLSVVGRTVSKIICSIVSNPANESSLTKFYQTIHKNLLFLFSPMTLFLNLNQILILLNSFR